MTREEISRRDKVHMELRDGFMMNTQSRYKLWPPTALGNDLGIQQIRAHQKHALCNPQLRPTANWMDSHSVWFARGFIYSCELPCVKKHGAKEYIEKCIHDGDTMTVFEPAWITKQIDGGMIYGTDLSIMIAAAEAQVGVKYDIGQLLSMAANRWWGSEWEYRFRGLDFSSKRHVCSVYVAIIYETWRKKQLVKIDRPFSRMNRDYWTGKEYTGFKGVDIEATFPALYANSKFFAGEYKERVRV